MKIAKVEKRIEFDNEKVLRRALSSVSFSREDREALKPVSKERAKFVSEIGSKALAAVKRKA